MTVINKNATVLHGCSKIMPLTDFEAFAVNNNEEWLGCQDSNLGMPIPKTGALPLGDTPTERRT